MAKRSPVMTAGSPSSIAFDIGAMTPACFCTHSILLSLNGKDLRKEPIERRKAALAKLIRPHTQAFGLSIIWSSMTAR